MFPSTTPISKIIESTFFKHKMKGGVPVISAAIALRIITTIIAIEIMMYVWSIVVFAIVGGIYGVINKVDVCQDFSCAFKGGALVCIIPNAIIVLKLLWDSSSKMFRHGGYVQAEGDF